MFKRKHNPQHRRTVFVKTAAPTHHNHHHHRNAIVQVTTTAANMDTFPAWLSLDPAIDDDNLDTETSDLQNANLDECLPLLLAAPSVHAAAGPPFTLPPLQRAKHAAFLRDFLGRLPKGYASLDASRPWMLYWSLAGQSIAGSDVSSYRQRYLEPLLACLLAPALTRVRQSNRHSSSPAEHVGRFWWRPWPILTSCDVVCRSSQLGDRRRGSIGCHRSTSNV